MAFGNTSAEKSQTSFILATASLKSHLEFEELLEVKGFWLGCSRDFWILLATLGLATLFSVSAVYYGVELSTRRRWQHAPASDFLHGSPPRPPRREKSAAGQVWAAWTGTCSAHLELAARAAILFAACGATYWIPSLAWLQQEGLSMQYVAAMLAFMLWKDIGSTMQLIWTGFCGTALAVLNCILLFHVYPLGMARHDSFSGPWWFGMIDFWIFVFFVLGFQLSTNLRMFALSWHAYFSMCFINPHNTTVFTKNIFHLLLSCPAINALMGCILGSQLAILCTLFPTCLTSLGRAQDLILETSWQMGWLWERMLLHYSDDHPAERARSFSVEIWEFRKRCSQIEEYYTSSWWECFNWGRTGRVREQVQVHCKTMRLLTDWLESGLSAIRAADRGMASDKQLLRLLQPHLQELVLRTWALLCHSSQLACSGFDAASSSEDVEQVQQELLALGAAQAALASAFVKARRKDDLKEGNLAEHAFAFSLSSYAECLTSHALSTLGEKPQPAQRIPVRLSARLPRLRPFTKEEFLDFLHPALGYALSFYIGWIGIGTGNSWAIPQYSSTIAGTMAYLIFSGGKQGSALARIASRFMGVGAGTFLGQLMFFTSCMGEDIFGSDWKSYLILPGFIMTTFFIELVALYFAFASPTAGYQGLLVGCFFAQYFMATCSDDFDGLMRSSYTNLLSQFLAMFIATLIDLLVDLPSDVVAIARFADFADNFQSSIGELFLQRSLIFCCRDGQHVLDEAAESIDEAEKEFRGRKTPWRAKLAREGLEVYAELWILVTVMEYVASFAQVRRGSPKSVVPAYVVGGSEDLLPVLDFPDLADMVRSVLSRADTSMSLFERLLGHSRMDAKFDLPDGGAQQLLSHRQTHLKNLPQILQEVNARLALRKTSGRPLVTEDEYCQVATLLTNLFHIALRLAHLESRLVEEPEIVWKAEGTCHAVLLDIASKKIHPADPGFQAFDDVNPSWLSSLGKLSADSKSWSQPAMPYIAEHGVRSERGSRGSCGCLRLLM